MNIKKVAFIGANGSMGAKTAAIIASFGNLPVFMVARDITKAKQGVETAVKSVRSNSIRKNLIPVTYSELPGILRQCDWVIEAVSESYDIKKSVNLMISAVKKKDRIISTLTSGLSVSRLAEVFDEQDRARYLGLHFFNPPYKMLLCELIPSKYTDKMLLKELEQYLKTSLLRRVVQTTDSAAFAANRVGFQFINEAAIFAEKYEDRGGVAYIDALLGRYTGRSIAPLQTLDFVGLDTHQAILMNMKETLVDNASETFKIPNYLSTLIKKGYLGNKTGSGLYSTKEYKGVITRFVYNIKTGRYVPHVKPVIPFIQAVEEEIHNGRYQSAFEIVKHSKEPGAEIVRHFMARYISYSFSIIGSVLKTREMIDVAMGFGFNWLPPSAMVDLLGGVDSTVSFIQKQKLTAPELLTKHKRTNAPFYSLQDELDYRSFVQL